MKLDLTKARQLSQRVAALGSSTAPRPSYNPPRTIMGAIPVKGIDYMTPSEVQEIKDQIRREMALDAPPVDMKKLMDDVLKELKGKLSVNDLADMQSFMMKTRDGLVTRYKVEEMMHGGSAASSNTGTAIYGEVVSGSGTSWTLSQTPLSGTLRLFANGQRLALTTDYTLVGLTITTISSWATGTLLADFNY